MFSIPSLRASLSKSAAILTDTYYPFVTDSTIYTQVIKDNFLYIGGDFTRVCKVVDYKQNRFAVANTSNADALIPPSTLKLFNGDIYAVAIYGNFAFVGGDFTKYNDRDCLRIAKISLIDGTLDTTFDTTTGFNNRVSAIVVDGSGNVYAGGTFSTYKGVNRGFIAKLNGTSAALDNTFDTAVAFGLQVRCLAIDSSGLYVGGSFTDYKGTARGGIVKLDLTTAALNGTFNANPGFNGAVHSVALDGSGNIYAGGTFGAYNGTSRLRLAKLNATTAALDGTFDTSANGPNNQVSTLQVDASGLYVGGLFTQYKGVNAQYLVKVSISTSNTDVTFNTATGFNNEVRSLVLDGAGNIYAGGSFTAYKTNLVVERIVKLNKTDASEITQFVVSNACDNAVNAMAMIDSSRICLGGSFDNFKFINNCKIRRGVAKISLINGNIDESFNTETGVRGSVRTIALDSLNKMYIGGSTITAYKGNTVQYIVKVDANTAQIDTQFDTSTAFDGAVNSIVVDSENNVYVGGGFSFYKSSGAFGVVKLNPTNASADSTFNTRLSGTNGYVQKLRIYQNSLYMCGGFSSYKGTSRLYMAKLSLIDASLDNTFDTASGFNNVVNSFDFDELGDLFAVGNFTTYKGTSRVRVAKISSTNAALNTTFAPGTGFSSQTWDVACDKNGSIFVGGQYTAYAGTSARYLAKVNSVTGAIVTAFNTTTTSPSVLQSTVFSIVINAFGRLYVGGLFTSSGPTGYGNSRHAVILNQTDAAKIGY